MRCRDSILCLVVCIGVLLGAGGVAAAIDFNVALTLETSGIYTNEVAATLTLVGYGGAVIPGVPSTNVATGDFTTQLAVTFGAGNAATVNTIRFTPDNPGHISYGSTSFPTMNPPLLFENMYGSFNYADHLGAVTPPVAVDGAGEFPTAGHYGLLNQGVIYASGSPVVNIPPDYPVWRPLEGGPGTIVVGSPYLADGWTKYNVTLTMPVDFSQELLPFAPGVVAGVSGTLRGVGSFSLFTGDANLDGTVNVADLTNLLNNYNKTGMVWANGNFTGDDVVNVADLTALLNNYNKTPGAVMVVGTAVPEPGSLITLAGIALTTLLYWWRKRA